MSIGLIGRKVGVTQVFQADGTMVAVSVVAIQPNTVTRLRTEARDGYVAVQLGAEPAKRLTKPAAGQLKDLPKAAQALATIREFRLESIDGYEVGRRIKESRPEKPPFVIAVTAQPEDARRRGEAGIDLYLMKPVDPPRLASLLRRFGKVVEVAESVPQPPLTVPQMA